MVNHPDQEHVEPMMLLGRALDLTKEIGEELTRISIGARQLAG
jgi:hypothetical protein